MKNHLYLMLKGFWMEGNPKMNNKRPKSLNNKISPLKKTNIAFKHYKSHYIYISFFKNKDNFKI